MPLGVLGPLVLRLSKCERGGGLTDLGGSRRTAQLRATLIRDERINT